MFNSIKVDYYRIFRSVGFWGVQAFCIFESSSPFSLPKPSVPTTVSFAIYAVTYNIGMLFIACNVMTSLLPLQFILLYTLVLVIEFVRTGGNMGTLPANFWGQFAILLSCRSSVPMLGTALPALSST